MQYCGNCKIRISSKTDRCPLCHNVLPASAHAGTQEDHPTYEPVKAGNKKLIQAVSIAASAVTALTVLINLLTWNGSLWCALSSACILYAWGGGLMTCSRRVHLGWKLTVHAIAIPLLLILFNAFAYNTETIHRITWAVSYCTPFIYICFIIAINSIMLKWRQNRHDYLLYQMALCAIGFTPLILALCGLVEPLWPSIAAAACAFLTIAGLILFAKKIIRSELVKKFHI